MTDLTIRSPGSTVVIGDHRAVIQAVMIRENMNVSYEVAWIVSGDRKCSWVSPMEIEDVPRTKTTVIGFAP
jgi:hypothetical protein